jgi:hypothetical protein
LKALLFYQTVDSIEAILNLHGMVDFLYLFKLWSLMELKSFVPVTATKVIVTVQNSIVCLIEELLLLPLYNCVQEFI